VEVSWTKLPTHIMTTVANIIINILIYTFYESFTAADIIKYKNIIKSIMLNHNLSYYSKRYGSL